MTWFKCSSGSSQGGGITLDGLDGLEDDQALLYPYSAGGSKQTLTLIPSNNNKYCNLNNISNGGVLVVDLKKVATNGGLNLYLFQLSNANPCIAMLYKDQELLYWRAVTGGGSLTEYIDSSTADLLIIPIFPKSNYTPQLMFYYQ